MKKEVTVNIDGKEFVVEISVDNNLNIDSVVVDGEIIEFDEIENINIQESGNNIDAKLKLDSDELNKSESNSSSHNIITPMAGVILKIIKNKGDSVSKGDDLIVVESMKMEQIIKSDYDGIVDVINVDLNEQVSAGKILMTIS
ncbi:MAG: acetyl-CoA carboxylase biotin carboxyl carrier protein subunit [SAR202 cluster bacterium]|nr:acetyl-CoA carboxylase biotin carboxyl carrier protein subunit [SAR202 cluster bacterium]